jgi:hypothetical protein
MLVAYEDLGLKIKDIPGDDTRVGPHPIATYEDAVRIRDEAVAERPEVRWEIVGKGPWGVHGKVMAGMKGPSKKVLEKHGKFLAAWEAAGFPDRFEYGGTSLKTLLVTAEWYREQKQKAGKEAGGEG